MLVKQKLLSLGGRAAEAWATIEAAMVTRPEKGSAEAANLADAKKLAQGLVAMLQDPAFDADWASIQEALKHPGVSASVDHAKLLEYQRLAVRYLQYVEDVLAGKTPEAPPLPQIKVKVRAAKGVPLELDAKSAQALGVLPRRGRPAKTAVAVDAETATRGQG
jgi:hypothetical protein